VPLVDSCDISNAASFLCDALRAATASGHVPLGGQTALDTLLQFCNVASQECQDNAESASADIR
jgi:hypothetical protein